MNRHVVRDRISLAAAALKSGRNKFFSRSVDSSAIPELLGEISLTAPEITGEGQFDLVARLPARQLDPAFFVAQWPGKNFPTILYFHDFGERPFVFHRWAKNTFRHIFLEAHPQIHANLIVMRAPFHALPRPLFGRVMGEMSAFTAMLAVSVRMAENLVLYLRKRGRGRILLSGMGLGGGVANLHRAFFNSADIYLPLLAGAGLGDVFLDSDFRWLTGKAALSNPEAVRRILNFDELFARVPENNVFPLMARYDRIVRLERQRRCYGARPVEILDKGHVTAAGSAERLRAHILRHLAS